MTKFPGDNKFFALISGSSINLGRRDVAYASMLMILAIVYTLSYLANPYLPGNIVAEPRGWWGWFDQGQYLASTLALASGNLSSTLHHYPLGYAAIAAPFTNLTEVHPFYLVNLLAFIGACHVFTKICGVFSIDKIVAVFLFVFSIFADALIFQQFTTPWSTTPVVLYVYVILYITIRENVPELPSVVGVAAVAAVLIVTRPSDIIVVLPAGLALIWRLFNAFGAKRALLFLAAGAATAVTILGLYLALHAAIFGFAQSPYMIQSRIVGFDGRFFLEKLYAVLINPLPLYGEGEGILRRSPWMLFAVPGLVVGLVHGWR